MPVRVGGRYQMMLRVDPRSRGRSVGLEKWVTVVMDKASVAAACDRSPDVREAKRMSTKEATN